MLEEIEADIIKFETQLEAYLSGTLSDEVFRVFRLNNGIYGQRQGGHHQMVRIKAPYGAISADQLEMLAYVAQTYSRGWGHLTTRQNIQFHFVALERVPALLRDLASVGLTTREACGDTVRNVAGCHLAGACPFEVLDISGWAEATFQHFLHNPIAQRLPRKFKINFSGCDTDCGQAAFNDVGVIATSRRLPDGTLEPGFRVYVAGGLGANPHPALALEDFTERQDLLPTIEAVLRVFDQAGNRENKLRARMKWLVDTIGFEELQRRVFATRKFLLASSSWPGGIPPAVQDVGDAPAGVAVGVSPTPMGHGVPVSIGAKSAYVRWCEANVVRGVAKKTVSAYAYARLGDVTSSQFQTLATVQRELGFDVRITNRQNFVLRDLQEPQLPALYSVLSGIDMDLPAAELARDVVACPGADTCNLAVTQSRGLADAIGVGLVDAGLDELGGVRINISGCTNSCGQHHVADIGFSGAERRAHGQSAPGYTMFLGGHVGQTQVTFGRRALRVPAKSAPAATVAVLERFAVHRRPGEAFQDWLARYGLDILVAELESFGVFPEPDVSPEFYVDYAETAPYVAEVGASECAT